MEEEQTLKDYVSFVDVVKQGLQRRLDLMGGWKLLDIGMKHSSSFIETPGSDWFMLVIWLQNAVTQAVYEINQKFGGQVGQTGPEDVEPLCEKIISKFQECLDTDTEIKAEA